MKKKPHTHTHTLNENLQKERNYYNKNILEAKKLMMKLRREVYLCIYLFIYYT